MVFVQFAVASLRTSLVSVLRLARSQRRRGTPVVIGCHETSRELALIGPVARVIYRGVVGSATVILTFSPNEAEVMRSRRLASKIDSIPLGVPSTVPDQRAIDRVRETYGISKPLVLSVGFVHHDKGTDLLIDAALEVYRRQRGDVQFLVAGSPRLRHGIFRVLGRADESFHSHLLQRASCLRTTANFSITSYVREEDLCPLLTLASVVVLPYRRATQSAIATEALAAGAAIVASDLPAIRTQLGRAAIYFKSGDPAQLAKSVSRVLEAGELQAALRSAAADLARSQTFESVGQQILAMGGVVEVPA
jgi:glycosyltransferase involved in cell wall biosynthesis